MSKFSQFMEQVKTDSKVQELIKKLEKPKSDVEALKGYLTLAKEMNIEISEKEMLDGLKATVKERREKSEKAAEQVKIDTEELEKVSGGGDAGLICQSTYVEDEWCWFSDSCITVIHYYAPTDYYNDTHGRDSEFDGSDISDDDYDPSAWCKNQADEWQIFD